MINHIGQVGRRIGILILAVVVVLGASTGCSPESKKRSHLARANRYLAAGDLSSAEVELMNVLRIDQQNAEAWSKLGRIFFDQGELPKAFEALKRAKPLAPNDLEVRSKLAIFHAGMRQTNEARAEMTFILEKDPAHEDTVLMIPDMVDMRSAAKEVPEAMGRIAALRQKGGDKAVYQVAIGSLLLRTNDLVGAEAAFKRAIALDPNMSAAHLSLANLQWALGRTNEAAPGFAKVFELAPTHSPKRLRAVDFKLRTGAVDEAKKMLEIISKTAPDYLPAGLYKARLAFAEKKYDDCSKHLESVIARDGLNIEALLLRAQLRLAKGEFAKAVTELERVATQYARAPQVHYQLALAHLLNQNLNKAVASFQQTLVLDPNNIQATLALAELNMRRGESTTAILALQQVLVKQPKLVQAQFALAKAYQFANRIDDAIGEYKKLATAAPSNREPVYLLGTVYRQKQLTLAEARRRADPKSPAGRFSEAEKQVLAEARKSFERVLELSPDYPQAIEQLLELDLQAREFAAAKTRIQQQVAKYPKEAGPLYFLAQIHLVETNLPAAESTLMKVVELAPDNRQAQIALAQLYLRQKKEAEAIKRLEETLAKNPNETGALMMLGMLYGEQNELKKAQSLYERLLKVDPNAINALNNLAYLYSEKLGDQDRAFELAQKAYKLNPRSPYAADTLGWIVLKRGEYAWALDLISESAEKFRNARVAGSAEVIYHLGMAHYMMGEEQPAITALQQVLASGQPFPGKEDAERALAVLTLDAKATDPATIATLEKAHDKQPDDPVVLSRLSRNYESQGNGQKVVQLYEQAYRKNSKSVPILVRLGQLNVDVLKNNTEALKYTRAARTLNPDDLTLAGVLGRIAFKAGDHRYAYSLLQEAMRTESKDAEFMYDLAWSSYSMGRVRDALDQMQSAVQLGGTSFARKDAASWFLAMVNATENPAQLSSVSGRIADLLKADPNHGPGLMASALVHEQQGRGVQAQEAYRKVLEIYPGFVPAARKLAILLAAEPGKEKEAYELAVKARESFTDDAELERTIGLLAYGRNDLVLASQMLKLSVRKRAPDVDVLYHLGLVQVKGTEKKDGVDNLKKALSMKPDHRLAKEAQAAVAGVK